MAGQNHNISGVCTVILARKTPNIWCIYRDSGSYLLFCGSLIPTKVTPSVALLVSSQAGHLCPSPQGTGVHSMKSLSSPSLTAFQQRSGKLPTLSQCPSPRNRSQGQNSYGQQGRRPSFRVQHVLNCRHSLEHDLATREEVRKGLSCGQDEDDGYQACATAHVMLAASLAGVWGCVDVYVYLCVHVCVCVCACVCALSRVRVCSAFL
jgi:hypothetical protein